MGDFDQAAKYALQLDGPAFVRWHLPGLLATHRFLRWVNAELPALPDEPGRQCDVVAELEPLDPAGPRSLLDIEAQTEPDAHVMERFGEYACRLRREFRHGPGRAGKYRVASLLLTLTGPRQPDELDLREPGLNGDGLHLRVTQVVFRDEDAAATLDGVAAGTVPDCALPWVPLMRGGDRSDVIRRWRQVAEADPDERQRRVYAALALVFSLLTDCRPLWDRELEDWQVKTASIVQEWKDEARLETSRALLLQVLNRRFPNVVTPQVLVAISAETDLGKFTRWFDAAAVAPSFDAFRAQADL